MSSEGAGNQGSKDHRLGVSRGCHRVVERTIDNKVKSRPRIYTLLTRIDGAGCRLQAAGCS
jgi:hypothetical protein